MDYQYQFLKRLCAMSEGRTRVTDSQIRAIWDGCPDKEVLVNLANYAYMDIEHEGGEISYMPSPTAFSYVRQCRDSIRNLIVTSATLFVSVLTLLASVYAIVDPFFQ